MKYVRRPIFVSAHEPSEAGVWAGCPALPVCSHTQQPTAARWGHRRLRRGAPPLRRAEDAGPLLPCLRCSQAQSDPTHRQQTHGLKRSDRKGGDLGDRHPWGQRSEPPDRSSYGPWQPQDVVSRHPPRAQLPTWAQVPHMAGRGTGGSAHLSPPVLRSWVSARLKPLWSDLCVTPPTRPLQ